jgi:nuclear receptor subfamily 1 group D protein 3
LEIKSAVSAVRFGRVPKKEKAKMAEEMQKATVRSQLDAMSVELEDDQVLVNAIHSAFIELGTRLRRDLLNARSTTFVTLDGNETLLNSSFYLPAILAVVNFSKHVKGFQLLFQNDRIHLLKTSFFQILLLRLTTLTRNENGQQLDPNTIPQYLFLDFPADKAETSSLLRNSVVEFAQRFRILGLDEQQQSLLAALVMCQSESTSTHFQEPSLTKMLQEKLWWLLQSSIFPNPQAIHSITGPMLVQSLFATFADLKTLDTLYREQMQTLRCYSMPPSTIIGQPPMSTVKVEKKGTTNFYLDNSNTISASPKQPSIKKPKKNNDCPVITQLLEQPSLILQQQQKAKPEESEDDQPLNLCVRDNPPV